jgi:hypothetical protein
MSKYHKVVRVKFPGRLTVMTPKYFNDWMQENGYFLFDDFTIHASRDSDEIIGRVKAESMKDYHYFHLVHGQS